MEQKLITHRDRAGFDAEVNDYLSKGWRVVPGTMAIGIACCRDEAADFRYTFAVVLEKSTVPAVRGA